MVARSPSQHLMPRNGHGPLVAAVVAFICMMHAWVGSAQASVKKEGTWPADEKAVSFQYEGARIGGLEKLAEQAGWSLVLSDKAALASPRTVSVALKGQSPADVLDALLDDGEFVAIRKGTLVRVELVDAGAKDVSATSDATPVVATTSRTDATGDDAEDLKVMGGHGQLDKGQTVRNLTVMGGSCDVYGRVDGDVSVMGGRVTLHEGAVVEHDVTTMGGHVEIERGATVRGRYATLGGSIHREDGAVVSGHVEGAGVGKSSSKRSDGPKSFIHRVGDAVSNTAILFVLGVVFLAIAPKRMEMLRVEVARAPMRQVGLGIVGFFGFLVAVIVLCVTVIGIPVALIAVFLGLVGLYGGMVAGLAVIGAALVRHKSENPYVHLAVGCFVFFVVYPLPFIGPPLTFALLLLGVGVLVSTRFAGFFPTKKKADTVDIGGEGPYR
jgi:hypothetical protein